MILKIRGTSIPSCNWRMLVKFQFFNQQYIGNFLLINFVRFLLKRKSSQMISLSIIQHPKPFSSSVNMTSRALPRLKKCVGVWGRQSNY